jgi:hypothetical protein
MNICLILTVIFINIYMSYLNGHIFEYLSFPNGVVLRLMCVRKKREKKKKRKERKERDINENFYSFLMIW